MTKDLRIPDENLQPLIELFVEVCSVPNPNDRLMAMQRAAGEALQQINPEVFAIAEANLGSFTLQ